MSMPLVQATIGAPVLVAIPTDPQLWLVQLFNGFVLGAVLVLAALGLSLIFGLMKILNFAHGALILIGAYATWSVTTATGSLILGVLAAPLVVGVIGAGIERFTLRRVYDRPEFIQLLLTFGFAQFLAGAIEAIYGSQSKSISVPAWATGEVSLVLFSYPLFRLLIIVMTATLVAGLFLFINRTDMGLIIRAALDDRHMTDALGIDISRIYLAVYAIGAALAGLAGALVGPLRGVDLAIAVQILVPTFVVVVVGGMGSLIGSVVAGLIIGELIAITSLIFPAGSQLVIYVFMALVLLVRPRGLFGEEGIR